MTSSCCDHEQGLEVLMENVTSVGFTSCALRHNAKLPDLELAGGPAATGPAQALLERPPSRGDSLCTAGTFSLAHYCYSPSHLYMPTLVVLYVLYHNGDDTHCVGMRDTAWLALLGRCEDASSDMTCDSAGCCIPAFYMCNMSHGQHCAADITRCTSNTANV